MSFVTKRTLRDCPRCGHDHENIEILKFSRPVIDPSPSDPTDPCQYHYWATCPSTGEPIPLKSRNKEDIYMPMAARTEDIALAAYKIWEKEGKQHGHDVEHWLRAEKSIRRYYRLPKRYKVESTNLVTKNS
jgi:hypothetical protein